jgi:hypothetical protein
MLTVAFGVVSLLVACGDTRDSSVGDNVTADLAPEPTADVPTGLAAHDMVTDFGGYDWRVLAVEDGKALLISEDIIDLRAYNQGSDVDTETSWADCTLRAWLNNDFFNGAFSAQEKALVVETTVVTPENSRHGTSGGPDTVDNVFLLSIQEAQSYFSSDADRVAVVGSMSEAQKEDLARRLEAEGSYMSYEEILMFDVEGNIGKPLGWWLRSPGVQLYGPAEVRAEGWIYFDGNFGYKIERMAGITGAGVRPALWIKQ